MNTTAKIDSFIDEITVLGLKLYRDFAWKQTSDPYAVLVSEVMLQQTQTARVERYFEKWMELFPTIDALAAASLADVLEIWQGLGYNRRALALKRTAEIVSEQFAGVLPDSSDELIKLPGIGAATAAGVMAFAYDEPAVYLETNVRTVLLHMFYPDDSDISDKELRQLLSDISERASARGLSARAWNYALLDSGAHFKKAFANPSRRSKHHSKQSAYEGSRRQKRARLLEAVLAGPGQNTENLAHLFGYDYDLAKSILSDLENEGFMSCEDDCWFI